MNIDNFISYKQLGNRGRLGNQLFQVAATEATACHNNVQAIFPRWTDKSSDEIKLGNFTGPFNNVARHKIICDECCNRTKTPRYKPIQYHGGRLELLGCYNSDEYFKGYEELIRQKFTFVSKIIERAHKITDGTGICSIHFRRDDFLKFYGANKLTFKNYYKKAIKTSKCNNFLIFSDDIKWCKKNLRNAISGKIDFVNNSNNEVVDMAAMSLCEVNIIANSTFSWWAAYLGNSHRVIMPAVWYNPKKRKEPMYSPSHWIKV